MNFNKRIREKIIADFSERGYSFSMFKADRDKQKYHINERNFFNKVLRNELKLEKEFLNLLVMKNEQLATVMSDYIFRTDGRKRKLCNPDHNILPLKDFVMIHIMITNNYRVLKENFLNGMNYQGMVLFRNTIELTELSIGILGDNELHQFYRKDIRPDIDGGVYQSLKFGRVKSKTYHIMKWVKSLPNNNFPQGLWDDYLLIRQNLYEASSKHTHSNFESIVSNAFVKHIDSKEIGDNDTMMLNIGGIISTHSKNSIRDVLIYEAISYMIFIILLIEKYKLPFRYFGKDANYTIALSKMGLELIHEYLHPASPDVS